MIDDILGEWDVILGEQGRGDWEGRIAFLQVDGRLVVRDADPESRAAPSRVDVAGTTLRFEMLSAGSSRGNAHHTFELSPTADGTLRGTRRRGLLARTPLVCMRVVGTDANTSTAVAAADAPAPAATVGSEALAEVRARAAAAAERAHLAAAQAAAAAAEAEAAEALEIARLAAARVTAARAAVQQLGQVAGAAAGETRTEVPSEVLAILPAPSQPPVIAPGPLPTVAPAAETAPAGIAQAEAAVLDDVTAAEELDAASESEFRDAVAG